MRRRTEIQLVLIAIGLIVWTYGQRTDNSRLRLIGTGFFGAAFLLRFFKKKPDTTADSPEHRE